jgi:hypothetical protein
LKNKTKRKEQERKENRETNKANDEQYQRCVHQLNNENTTLAHINGTSQAKPENIERKSAQGLSLQTTCIHHKELTRKKKTKDVSTQQTHASAKQRMLQ